MAQIVSGASADIMTVDPTSKAARVSLYGPDGEPLLYGSNRDRGIASVAVRQTATSAAAVVAWALRSGTVGKTLYITRIWLQLWFDGTGAATEMRYELVKGTGCTAMSGGAVVTPLLKRSSANNPDADARVLDTGLTLTGVSYGTPFWNCAWSRLTHSATQAGGVSNPFVLEFGSMPIELAKDEVLALRLLATAVIGDNVGGGVEFNGN
jgi:hypothetical protein